ncbi:MAG: UPF0149 family protein [Polyangiaceae bacterium]
MISPHEPDFESLDALLDGDLSMTPEEMMGVLVAVFSARQLVPPSQWMPLVFGEREPSEADGPAISALMEEYNEVGRMLEEEGMLSPEPDDLDAIADFCSGYLAVMDLDQTWLREEEEIAFVLLALCDHSMLDDPRLKLEGTKAEWIASACEELPQLLDEMYTKNRGRHPGAGKQATSKKVDRNAPCPCGSGKKYKKCCGAA